MKWPDDATADLIAQLDGAADPATRAHWTRYLKGDAAFRGVPMAGVRAAVRYTWRTHALADRPTTDLLGLAQRWFASPWTEDKLAAVLLLAEQLASRLEPDHLDALAQPFTAGHIGDWNVCDWYATKALHAFITAAPTELEQRARALAGWTDAPELWQRRAGLVSLVKWAPRGDEVFPGFTALLLDACTANLVSDNRFAHTGPGWVLRELSRAAPNDVARYVDHHPQLSREARRMATARLHNGPYRRR